MKYIKIFIVANVAVLVSLLYLPSFLVTGDLSVVEGMMNSISE